MIPLPRLIDSNGNEVRRIHPVRVSLTENSVPLSTAQITLLPEDSIPYRSFVELFTANGSAGFYRAKTPSVGYGNRTNTVQLEHAICEVGDYIVKGEIEQTIMTFENALLLTFSHYGGSLWQIGTVSIDENVVVSGNYSNVLQMLNSLIALVPDAIMTFDFTTTPWTFNVASRETTVSAEGRMARNIVNATVQRNDNELCTRIWVSGLSDDPTESYMDSDTISTYGVIEKALSTSEYTYDEAVLMATSYIEKHKHPTHSVTINGVDLSSITGETLDRFKIGKLYRLILPDNEPIDGIIVKLTWNDVYNLPGVVSITLSAEQDQTTYTLLQSQSTEIYGNNGIKEKVGKDYTSLSNAIAKRYVKQMGVDILEDGIDVHGSNKFIKARSGAAFYGRIGRESTEATDFNDLTTEGFYYLSITSSTGNKPSGIATGTADVEVQSISDTILVQRVFTESVLYQRRRTSGTWGSWYKFTGASA